MRVRATCASSSGSWSVMSWVTYVVCECHLSCSTRDDCSAPKYHLAAALLGCCSSQEVFQIMEVTCFRVCAPPQRGQRRRTLAPSSQAQPLPCPCPQSQMSPARDSGVVRGHCVWRARLPSDRVQQGRVSEQSASSVQTPGTWRSAFWGMRTSGDCSGTWKVLEFRWRAWPARGWGRWVGSRLWQTWS